MPFEEVYEEQNHLIQNVWFHGQVYITRSLYLASCALNNYSLKRFAQETFLQLLSKPEDQWGTLGSSLSTGKAGVLAISHLMLEDMPHLDLHYKLISLENDLKKLYNPSHPFGFQVMSPNGLQYIDDPSLIEGAIGIALALLLVQKRDPALWTRILLLR